MSKRHIIEGSPRSTRHTGVTIEPRRVASRQEGVVKNVGIKPKKKLKKEK